MRGEKYDMCGNFYSPEYGAWIVLKRDGLFCVIGFDVLIYSVRGEDF